MPLTIDLGSLGNKGFTIIGRQGGAYAGNSVSSAGDINGDGFDDILVGAVGANSAGGEAYILYGKASGFADIDTSTLSLSDSRGFTLSGFAVGNHLGRDVASAGDINGDGFDDFLLGAANAGHGYENGIGKAYVIFGRAAGRDSSNIGSLGAGDMFTVRGDASSDHAGYSVSSAGDINGDGYDDFIVGAPGGDNGGSDAGEAYVIFGKAGGFADIDLTGFTLADGFIIQGDAVGDQLGLSVSSAGDVNGDGYDDLIVGASFGNTGGTSAGQAYVIFGKSTGFANIDLTSLAAADGFSIQGDAAGDRAGFSVSSAGDFNNDGIDDMLVGARYGDNGGGNAGQAYIIFGKLSGLANIDLTSLTAADGIIIQGDAAGDQAGRSVSAAGDVNGDGFDDIIIGAPYGDLDANYAGQAYVIFGRGGTPGNIDLTNLSATDGITIIGDQTFGWAGYSVSSAGDVNGDGFADVIVGAIISDIDGRANPGKAYVIFGAATSVDLTDLGGDAVTCIDSVGPVLLDDASAPELAASLVTDVTSLDGATLTVAITANLASFQDVLGISTAGTITLSGGTNVGSIVSVGGVAIGTIEANGKSGSSLVISFDTADATPANITTLVRALTYANTSIEPWTATRTISIGLDAGGIGNDSASVQVAVVAANNAPTVTATSVNPTFTEGGYEVDLFAGISVGGFEPGQLVDSFTIGVTNVQDGSSEALTVYGELVPLVNGFTSDISIGHVAVTITGTSASVTITADPLSPLSPGVLAINIDNLRYRNTSEDPTAGTRTITILEVNDSGGGTLPDDDSGNPALSSVVTVVAVDDAPVAVDDLTAVFETQTLDGASVVTNDSDIDGPALQIAAVNGLAANVGTQITLGSGAHLTMNADGTYDYDPNGSFGSLISQATADETGAVNSSTADVFNYTLTNGNLAMVIIVIKGEDTPNDRLSGDFNDNVMTGTPGNDVFDLDQDGNDTVNGMGGDDTFFLGWALNGLDSIDGGAGYDTVSLYGFHGGTPLVFGANTLVNVERLSFSQASWNVTTNDATVAAGTELKVEAPGFWVAYALEFDGSAESDGHFYFDDGLGNDVLIGGAGDDLFMFNYGSNNFQGGLGTDLLDYSDASGAVIANLLTGIVSTSGGGGTDLVSGIENLTGSDFDDQLTGSALANLINGGGGADRLVGGKGDDTYYFDDIGDAAIEKAGNGIDTIISAVGLSMDAGVDNVTLTGLAAINATGNGLDNLMIGNFADNELNGFIGADEMRGGAGNDTYRVDNVGDVVVENAGEGIDTIISPNSLTLGANVENLTLVGTASIAIGNELANILAGNALGNTLNGAGGADEMRGGAGDDVYFVDEIADKAVEGSGKGTDTVNSSVSFTLTAFVENLTLTGTADIDATGNGQANLLLGNIGSNRLDGGAGADEMRGGAGDDYYIVDNAGDLVVEGGNNGIDSVTSSVSFTLGASVEYLDLVGSSAISGTGNNADNMIVGNGAANTLSGGAGVDVLVGGAGADTLQGGIGDDILSGGAGHDDLSGGTGDDDFYFVAAPSAANNVDHILDFNVADDSILLDIFIFTGIATDGPLAVGAFQAGTVALDADDRILYDSVTGFIRYDADGLGGTAAILFATVTPGTALTSADFVGW